MDSLNAVWYIVLPICLFLSVVGCCCCKLQESKRRTINRRRRVRRITTAGSSPPSRSADIFVINDSVSHPQIELPAYTPYVSANTFSPLPPTYNNAEDLPPSYDPPSYEEAVAEDATC